MEKNKISEFYIMNNLITQTSHPLIKSEQTYVLDRKLISIHSGDRDFNKWPNSNEFGVDLGVNFNNVQSMRLVNFAIPVNHYTFSDSYQNTKLSFTYSLNYPIYLTNFNSSGNHSVSFVLFKEILKTLFGQFTALSKKSPNVIIQYWNTNANIWETLPSNYGWVNSPTGNIGKYRFVWEQTFTITIPEGAYSPDNLCTTIESLMNQKIYNVSSQTDLSGGTFDFLPGTTSNGPNGGQTTFTADASSVILPSNDEDSFWNPSKGRGITPFVVHYNNVTNKVLFGCKQGEFTLNFKEKESYDSQCNNGKSIFNQYTKWGLGSYLGFNKKNYSSVMTDVTLDLSGGNGSYQSTIQQGITLPHEMPSPWLVGNAASLDISGTSGNDPTSTSGWGVTEVGQVLLGNTKDNDQIKNLVSTIEAEYNLDVHGEDALYMEIDKYNNIDEIYPYSERTGHMYNNDLAPRTNGSFARIPLSHLPFGQEMGSRNNFVINVFHTDPPIKKINRLKFKFRFHDGRLVDFKNLPFSFTLEFNMLKDEQDRVKRIRVPPLYNL